MADTRQDIFNRIAERVKLPALPEVIARLLKMFDDPEITAAQVSEIINKDAALVTRLLRVANSAYYGGGGNVATVQQAIIKLGFRTTKAVVLSTGVYSSIGKSVPRDLDLRPFWQHSLEVAVAAMLFAEDICPRQSEEAFVAGLLHDIGRVGLAVAFPDEFKKLIAGQLGGWTAQQEVSVFGVEHQELGAFLAGRWNFPESLQAAIRRHHEVPETLVTDPRERVPLCVALADTVARSSWAGPAALRPECRDLRDRLCKLTGVDAERLKAVETQVAPQMSEWAALLDIDLGDPAELLAEANTKLFELYRVMDELMRDNEKLHSQLIVEERERASLEALKIICATFSHHINNATTTILGRAQLVNLALSRGEMEDLAGKIGQSMKVIENAVDTISGVLGELKCLTRFDTISYHGKSSIIKLKREIVAETAEP
jgi:putative nucleotidyltransferase with HDIG domain